MLGLSALASNPNWIAEILARYEQAWLAQESGTTFVQMNGVSESPNGELVVRLLSEENELTVAAKLSWVRHVRQAFDDLPQ